MGITGLCGAGSEPTGLADDILCKFIESSQRCSPLDQVFFKVASLDLSSSLYMLMHPIIQLHSPIFLYADDTVDRFNQFFGALFPFTRGS